MVNSEKNLEMDFLVSIPKRFEWRNGTGNIHEENPVMSDLRMANVSIDENSIVVSNGSVVIGYLFFAVIDFLFGAIAGGLLIAGKLEWVCAYFH